MSIVGIEDAVLAAVVTRLRADATLTALVTGVHDEVPQTLAYPYVQLGDSTVQKESTFAIDGRNVLLTIHVWSQYPGANETSTIMSRIGVLLDQYALTVTGAVVESCELETTQVMRDMDGRTRHGVIQLRVITAAS